MLSRTIPSISRVKSLVDKREGARVAILGAAGGLGQMTALVLKQMRFVEELVLHDIESLEAIGEDLSLIDTNCTVRIHEGAGQLADALKDADIVALIAGKRWKPGMTSQDLFNLNAGVIRSLAEACSLICPKAIIGVVSEPVNSLVPLVSEIYRFNKVYHPDKILGMASLEEVRSNAIVADYLGLDPISINVPIVGGCSENTLVPLLTKAEPYVHFNKDIIDSLTERIRAGERHVVELKEGQGSHVSSGYAAALFIQNLSRGFCGEHNVRMSSFVRSTAIPSCNYFLSQILLGPYGIKTNYGIPKLTPHEMLLLETAIVELQNDIKIAEGYIKQCIGTLDEELPKLA